MKRLMFVLAVVVVGLGVGCLDQRASLRNGTGTVYRHHFVGTEALEKGTNALKVKEVLQLPDTRDLRAYVLPQLAKAPQEFWRKHLPAPAPDIATWVQPLLEDLLTSESYVEVRGPNTQLEAALAVRLSDERARLWQTNLTQIARAWQMGAAAPVQVHGFTGLQVKTSRPPKLLQSVRARDWLVVAVGADALAGSVLQKIQQTGQPTSSLTNNLLLEFSADWPRLANWFPFFAHYTVPPTQLAVYGRGETVRTEGRFHFPQPHAWKFEPWRIPTNAIKDPLISFTAGRGIAPVLSQIRGVPEMGLKPLPNQFSGWVMADVPWQTYFALPVADATNAVQEIAPELPKLILDRWGKMPGDFVWLSNRAEVRWQGLPFVQPMVAPLLSNGDDFIFVGLFPRTPHTNTPPAELFAQLGDRKDLVYYDWEVTQPRLAHALQINSLVDILMRWQAPNPTKVPVRKWLSSVGPLLGNAVTEVTVSGPQEMSLVRRSPIGLTAVELIALSRWLESPGFPMRWEVPQTWERLRKTNAAPAAVTNRTKAPGPTPVRTNAPATPAKPAASVKPGAPPVVAPEKSR